MTLEEFHSKFLSNCTATLDNAYEHKPPIKVAGGKVLKSDQDFMEFAKEVAERLCEGVPSDETIDDNFICTFVEELMLSIYNGLRWDNFFEICKKLKVIKNERRNEERKAKKEKVKKTKQSKHEDLKSGPKQEKDKYPEPPKDNLFGGAATISSKQ
jgi:hypothetical protein